ncbi:hypothetical protein ABZY36_35305 [Streptomyces sp. NPDC006627]|uniref:hypothetical protein n=1 Tax=Streptomyces sp. NPDC006627 TaxID=3154679 RepID=UPI0033A112C8
MRGSTPDEDQWTLERQLLATVVDSVRENTFALVRLHGDPKKTKHMKPPKPIPRPGINQPKKSNVIRFGGRHGSGAAQLAQVFGGRAATQ